MSEIKKHKEPAQNSDRISYNEASVIVKDFKSRVRFCFGNQQRCIRLQVIPVGSYRRKKSTLKDVDFLILYPKRYAKYKDDILAGIKLNESKNTQIKLLTINPKMNGVVHSQYRAQLYKHPEMHFVLDLFLVAEGSYPFALFHYTGSKTFNIRTRAHVKRMGMLLNQYGLFDAKTSKKINSGIKTERDLFKYIDVTYKSPKQRSES